MKSSTGKLEHNGKMAQNLDICTPLYHPEQRKVSPRNMATQLFQDNKNFTLPAELFCLLLDFFRERLHELSKPFFEHVQHVDRIELRTHAK